MRRSPSPKQYRRDIDGLRGLAILGVLGFHGFPEILKGGFLGVDVFFVISGYLISGPIYASLIDRKPFLKKFFANRIRRIFPSLSLVLVTVFIFGWFFLLPSSFEKISLQIFAGATFWSNFLFLGQSGYFDTSAETKPLLHLWSLSVEEQFYIWFPFGLFVAFLIRIKPIVSVWLLLILSLGIQIFLIVSGDWVASFFLPFARFWELLAGAVLAWHMRSFVIPHRAKILKPKEQIGFVSAALALSIIWTAFFIPLSEGLQRLVVTLLVVIGTSLIIWPHTSSPIIQFLLENKVIVWLGKISFPLYLWHWVLLTIPLELGERPDSSGIRLLLLLFSIILAHLTYKLVEVPLRFRTKQKSTIFFLSMIMVGVVLGSFAVVISSGAPNRPLAVYTRLDPALFSPSSSNWADEIRLGTCHIQDSSLKKFDENCRVHGDSTMVLWGDSHAASLYPGLVAMTKNEKYVVDQFTSAGCPPVINPQSIYPNCKILNLRVLSELVTIQPEVLIMAARWSDDRLILSAEEVKNSLSETVSKLKEIIPNTKIVIVGQVPEWKINPMQDTYNSWLLSGIWDTNLPVYQRAEQKNDINRAIETLANSGHFVFISPSEFLCKSDGCLNRVGLHRNNWTAFDSAHLSPEGSRYFISKIWNLVLPRSGER